MTKSGPDTSNDMSYEDVCAIAWNGYEASQGNRQERTERIGCVASRGKGADEWTSVRKDDGGMKGGKKGSKGQQANLIGSVTRTEEALETQARTKARAKPDIVSE